MIQRWGVRFILAVVFGALGAGGFLLAAAPAQASVHSSATQAQAVASSLDDFSFDSLHTDYRLSRDAQHRADLTVTEKFVAQFDKDSYNHGIVRAIPTTADARSLHVQVKSITDGDGRPVPWAKSSDQTAGFLTIQIGDPDSFVSGTQTYVITYTMRDVVHEADGAQQFLFDVNGTGWEQRFGTVSATLHVPAALAGSLTGDTACYQGAQGSTTKCDITRSGGDGGGAVFTASGSDLGPHENVTMSVGFEPGTFAIPVSVVHIIVWVLLGIAIVVFALALWVRVRKLGNPKGTGIIVPQYQPFPGIGVMEAAELLDERDRSFPALITQLVVSRAATMTRDDRGTEKTKDDLYSLTLLDTTVLDDEDADAAGTLFGSRGRGTMVTLNPKKPQIGDRIRKLLSNARKSVRSQGLIRRPLTPLVFGMLALAAVVFLGAVVFGFVTVLIGLLAWQHLVAIGVIILLALGAGALVLPLERRTEKSVAAYEHLLGIRDYLRLAEADRIRVLQSPSGVETQPVAGAGQAPGAAGQPAGQPSTEQIVKLYEKLLPYAILFNIEKEWREVLGGYWQTTPTEVTPTLLPLQSLVFASAFASSNYPGTQSTSSGSHSWSNSGGGFSSSSGGFSGGGFGGGGGGGW